MTKPKQALVMGGGGVDMENPTIDLLALTLAGKQKPTVLFLPQASLENSGYVNHFHKVFGRYPCDTIHLVTSDLPTADLEDYVMQADIIYAGAGNTKIGLALWREFGLDVILHKAYEAGVVWVGGSAGFASITNEAITDSLGGLSIDRCLGLLPISGCAHYSSPVRRRVYKKAVYDGDICAGYGIDEGAAIHFVDGVVHRVVSNSIDAKAFSVGMVDGKLQHKRLHTIFLNEEENADNYIWSQEPFRDMTQRKREERAHSRSQALVVHGQEVEEEVEEL